MTTRSAPWGFVRALATPKWLSRLVALVGLVAVGSALSPELRDRVDLVDSLLPTAFPAAATTGAAATGVLLVALSRALRRGKFRAWLLATVLTALTVALHLVKGLDVEEATASVVVLCLLLVGRPGFTAKPDPRSGPRLLMVAFVAPLTAFLTGFSWLLLNSDSQAAGTTDTQRLAQAVLGLVGLTGPVRYVDTDAGNDAAAALAVLGAAVVLALLLVALRPASGPSYIDESQERRLRALLRHWGHIDSLGYLALRRDRSVLFSKSGKAAVTYRVVGNVSLVAGDPIGDPEAWAGAIKAWLDEARAFGWTPAVLGASEIGARAFVRAGMDALELGDEAVLQPAGFSLEGRSMRTVRQAVSRCRRAGLVAQCRRLRDIDVAERRELLVAADSWREGTVERGFSMALGRFCDDADGDAVVVTVRTEGGALVALLHLVPWGRNGLSLDLMRRDRETENGVVEFMVAELCRESARLDVDSISLNFAVLRSVFARGEELGAGPVLRVWRSLLLQLSRFWQIESLYRANLKYQPSWVPRFLCFRDAGDLARVGTAALRAEAILVAPRWWHRRGWTSPDVLAPADAGPDRPGSRLVAS